MAKKKATLPAPTAELDCETSGYWDADNLLRAFGLTEGQTRLSEFPPSTQLLQALRDLAAANHEEPRCYVEGFMERIDEWEQEQDQE